MNVDIAAWYKKYGPMVFRRCRALLRNEEEALDATQDVFTNLLKAKSRLEGRFPSSLLYTMATNLCLNRIRDKRNLRRFAEGEEEALPFIDRGSDYVEAKLITEAIMKDESESDRTICFMYYADGMTLKEIGDTVGLSISGVRKRLLGFQKRAKLKMEAGEEL
jgi:RNA polymerase sigma-70 factor (ECF subfamily)